MSRRGKALTPICIEIILAFIRYKTQTNYKNTTLKLVNLLLDDNAAAYDAVVLVQYGGLARGYCADVFGQLYMPIAVI